MAYKNEDGLWVQSNRDLAKVNDKGVTSGGGTTRTMTFDIKGVDLDTAYAYRATDPFMPRGAVIQSAKVYVKTAFAGGNLLVGTYEHNNTAIDADGLVTATEGAVANLVAGAAITGAGAQVGKAVGTLGAAGVIHVGITASAAMTAGEATVVVEYVYTGDKL